MGLTVADVVEEFNKFIEKWCGDNYPHLIDSDENDGERFRQLLKDALSPEKVVGMVEINREELAKILFIKSKTSIEGKYIGQKWEAWEKSKETRDWFYGFADAIISNKSKILGVKGER